MAGTEVASAAPFVPDGADLDMLRQAALGCHGCHLYENATQTVFSRGNANAEMVLVGEQPGDVEDQRGLPFVGPAGVLLRRAVGDVGLAPERLYITNAVKHFKFKQAGRGTRRIHQTPDQIEITACRPWLLAEFAQLSPRIVVALGATAAQALLGPAFRVTRQRGVLMPWPASAHRPADFGELASRTTRQLGELASRTTRQLGELASRTTRQLGELEGRTTRQLGEPGSTTAGHFGELASRTTRQSPQAGDRAQILATVHPSAILRADDRDTAYAGFVADLAVAAKALA